MKIKLPKIKASAKQKSLVLSVLAGIGVAATGIVSAKCARRVDDLDTVKEKVVKYAPAIAVGGATIGCIAASTYISHEEIAAVTAACVALGQKFSDYKKSVERVVTEEQLGQIDRDFYEREIERLEQELAEREHPTDDDDTSTFVDAFTGYTFKANKDDVLRGISEANKLYKEQEFLPWCDVFYFLNNEDTKPYESVIGSGFYYDYGYGWSEAMRKELEIEDDFEIFLDEMKERDNTYLINYSSVPEPCFLDF